MKSEQPTTFEELKRLLDERKRYQESLESYNKTIDGLQKELAGKLEGSKTCTSMIAKLEGQIREVGRVV
jgi:hypothetical protein